MCRTWKVMHVEIRYNTQSIWLVEEMSLRRHRLATLSALLISVWVSRWSPADFPHKGSVMRSVDAFLMLVWTLLIKQSKGRWFETQCPPVTSEFHSQRAVTGVFDVSFDLCLNKRLSKQSGRRWFETSSRSLGCHCNDISPDTSQETWKRG